MPRQQRKKSNSGYYHVMIRGNDRKNIFLDEEDKQNFIEILYQKKQENIYLLHAFCLMDNHVHLMLQEGEVDIANIMKRINISYVHYFNKKYKKIGHLFQDRFKSEGIEEERYILALIKYIHQNPVKAGITKTVEEYKWSSYAGYMQENHYYQKIVDTKMVLGLFSEDRQTAKRQFNEYVNQECTDEFIDIEEVEKMDEEDAKNLFREMMNSLMEEKRDNNAQIMEEVIRIFRDKTNLSIRQIAAITGLNKDKINKMLRG
ncbi:transposase [Sporomusa malonica]|uniref:transposase n=1 Tax=Sporomusa malonica TaxID=112901 RepID=UPI00352BC127